MWGGGGRERHGHRALRPGAGIGSTLRAAQGARPFQGPELLPASAEPGAARARGFPGRGIEEDRGARNRERGGGAQFFEARLHRELFYLRTPPPPVSWAP